MNPTSDDTYFEDFSEGDLIEHARGKTVTEMDNVLLTNLVRNTAEGHFNADVMADREFGERVVFGGISLSLVSGLASEDISENALRELGYEEISFERPVFHGDTLYARSEVLETRESVDPEGGGVVTFRLSGRNQDGEIVLEATKTVLLKKREADGVTGR